MNAPLGASAIQARALSVADADTLPPAGQRMLIRAGPDARPLV
jgi:hypothetical protein